MIDVKTDEENIARLWDIICMHTAFLMNNINRVLTDGKPRSSKETKRLTELYTIVSKIRRYTKDTSKGDIYRKD